MILKILRDPLGVRSVPGGKNGNSGHVQGDWSGAKIQNFSICRQT
jgi:hypothetical protein